MTAQEAWAKLKAWGLGDSEPYVPTDAVAVLDKHIDRLAELERERDEARRETEALLEERAMGGVRVFSDSATATEAELVRAANAARDVANRNKEIADANKRLRQKAEADRDAARADTARLTALLSDAAKVAADNLAMAGEATQSAQAARAEAAMLREVLAMVKHENDHCSMGGDVCLTPEQTAQIDTALSAPGSDWLAARLRAFGLRCIVMASSHASRAGQSDEAIVDRALATEPRATEAKPSSVVLPDDSVSLVLVWLHRCRATGAERRFEPTATCPDCRVSGPDCAKEPR